ncbi:MAG: UvrD-helicase domain-containing protein, partial [Pseudomonadales bacterium]|nr:UvrD-helicase domain-containing protein [Pseudomonadales bacterium]
MTNSSLSDQADRDAALDVTASYIVQAPAGSGKTELLTLRYLKLLAICEQPEEVLAITFTKKAAGEMRQRILGMLKWTLSAGEIGDSSSLHRLRYEICRPVIERDREKDWHILDNPSRLRVQTIDSFCFYLASQLPVLSRLGGNPTIAEDISPCFAAAVTNTVALLEQDSPLAEDMALLLRYLDNDVARVQTLLAGLLHNREQWLPHVLGIKSSFEDARMYLQESLEELIRESTSEVHEALIGRQMELLELINFMAENLAAESKLAVEDFAPLLTLPGSSHSALPYWRLLVEMLLTQSDGWRLRVDKRNGFPSGESQDKEFKALCKRRKAQFNDLAASLQGNDDLLEALAYLRKLPDPAYESRHWDFLSALTRLLEYLGAQLLVSFRSLGVIDYSQTSAAARSALGSPDDPTDLALALDHKIQHILVDEFQDTSQLQLDILQQLTSGWQVDDGRTLFLVGDAMQSCYGFRNANVGIYLNVRENGLASVKLHALTLQANFRSQEKLVSWVNRIFSTAFPARANSSRGAVPYSASTSVHAGLDGVGITTELICHQRDQAMAGRELEAQRVVARILQLKADHGDASVAILVRYRSHLRQLIPKLRAANIQWQSTDIDRLTTLPIIGDLLNLTAAVVNRGDRIAWLAILRAPWCGLTTADLHAIHSHAGEKSIWYALQQHSDIAALSAVAQEYLESFVAIMDYIVTA